MCYLKLSSTIDILKSQNEAKIDLISKLHDKISHISAKNLELKNQCDKKDTELLSKNTEINKLKKQNCFLQNKNVSLMAGKLPKTVCNKIIQSNLKGKFTEAQINRILKPVKPASVPGKKPIIRMSHCIS